MKKIRSIEELTIDSTKLCCNFVNTVYAWKGDDHFDFLKDYDAFIDWCIKLVFLDSGELTLLRARASAHPEEAEAAMVKIREVRLLMHDFISAIANQNKSVISDLLEKINPLIADALSEVELIFPGNQFIILHRKSPVHLVSPLHEISKSLYDLLTTESIAKMKECAGCGWVFLDETKNGKRRWCNPLTCGTRDKMNRYNIRKRRDASAQK